MKQDIANLDTHSGAEIPPNAKRLIGALRQIGYSLEQAISDLIDNSINALAKNVVIRFITSENKIISVVLADDGIGMKPEKLVDAMKFGSDEEASSGSLGKYGMGLKLASLSHAESLTVVSKCRNGISARRWTIEGIKKGWICDVIKEEDAVEFYNSRSFPFEISSHGTLVIWNEIDKLPTSAKGLVDTLKNIKLKLKNHLGLCFHRFIEDKKLNIYIDVQELNENIHGIKIEVEPLNPFGYPVSGHEEYPKKFKANIDGVGGLRFDAHIWPANSDLKNYKLGGRTSSRQGFYFYRNDRLIQTGGWNGVVQDENEPHGSLARVRIDLPSEYDSKFGLNVQKSAVIVPTSFVTAIMSSQSDDRDIFPKFRRKADTVYRKKDKGAHKYLPAVIGNGVPNSIAKKARTLLLSGGNKSKHIDFKWTHFETADLFSIDQTNGIIYLNKAYRKVLLRGSHGSQSDLPLLKTLIFFLTRDDFNKVRISAKRREELEIINKLITETAKLERG
jgi:hypothetical protein